MTDTRRLTWLYVLLSLAVICLGLLSLLCGSADFSPPELFAGLLGDERYRTAGFILTSLRLPRMAAALLAGVGLSLAGVLLQNVMQNPLVSPNTVGVNGGAGLAVVLCLSCFPGTIAVLPVAAFVGAFGTSLLILVLSRRVGGSRETVVLAGVACSSLFQAVISFFSTLDTDVLSLYTGFAIGSFRGVTMEQLLLPGILIVFCLVVSLGLSGRIGVLSLGDTLAASLGIRVVRMRILCLVLASLAAASVISYAGLLGFVGLVVPHMARKMGGAAGAKVVHQVGLSSLLGAALVMCSDLLGRVLFSPTEISVGILMAFLGAPFFFVLLLKRRQM